MGGWNENGWQAIFGPSHTDFTLVRVPKKGIKRILSAFFQSKSPSSARTGPSRA